MYLFKVSIYSKFSRIVEFTEGKNESKASILVKFCTGN